jgi:1-acyl-sn-glycerol-3-phosphate acyltransferase
MASREKGGIWVVLTAMLFRTGVWLAKCVYRGSENLPRQGGVILAMNHVSHFDPVVDAITVYRHKRVPRVLAKESVFRLPVLGLLAVKCGAVPVYRGSADAAQSLRAAVAALDEGKLVLIYPEGTISKDPTGWPMYPRTGVARLALDSRAVVIPCARWGTQNILNGYTKTFRPLPRKRVDVVFGEPIDMSAYRDRPVDGPLLREVTDVIMGRVRDLVGEIRQETPPTEYFRPSAKPDTKPDSVAG